MRMKYLYLATCVFSITLAALATVIAEHVQVLKDPMNPYVVSLIVLSFAMLGMYQLECSKEEHARVWSDA